MRTPPCRDEAVALKSPAGTDRQYAFTEQAGVVETASGAMSGVSVGHTSRPETYGLMNRGFRP